MKIKLFLLLVFTCTLLFADGIMPQYGTGIAENPYLIRCLDNLVWMSDTPDC